MIGIIDCRNCIHERPLKDGWKFCCDAFPEGTPLEFEFGLATAVGLFKGVFGMIPVLLSNAFSKKVSGTGLF